MTAVYGMLKVFGVRLEFAKVRDPGEIVEPPQFGLREYLIGSYGGVSRQEAQTITDQLGATAPYGMGDSVRFEWTPHSEELKPSRHDAASQAVVQVAR